MVAQVMSGQYHPPEIQRHDKDIKNETDLVHFTFQKKQSINHRTQQKNNNLSLSLSFENTSSR